MSFTIRHLLLLCLIPSFFWAEAKPSMVIDGNLFSMPFYFVCYDSLTESEKERVKKLIFFTFDQIDKCANHWNLVSELSHINRSESSQTSQMMHEILTEAKRLYEFTEGRYDATMGLWIFEKKQTPSFLLHSHTHFLRGWDKINLFAHSIQKPNNLCFDLDGFIKGYTLDLCDFHLKRLHLKHYLLQWGGEVKVSKEKKGNLPWAIAIKHATLNGAPLIIPLSDKGMATSGDYEQFLKHNGKAVSHIFSLSNATPTPLPLTKEAITISHPKCSIADAVATAAMTFSSIEEKFDYLSRLKAKDPLLEFWVVTTDSKL